MPYDAPSIQDFRTDFPAFSTVADDPIQRALDRTAQTVDESWMEGDYTYARELLAAHFLTLRGYGSGSEASVNSEGLAGFTSIRSASLSLTRSDTISAGSGNYSATSYGNEFAALLARNKGGPLVAVSDADCYAAQSTDIPWYWRKL